jgi:CRISPR/Cas system Type II protein with McrA/HNH and RuvC-like nuclease domain
VDEYRWGWNHDHLVPRSVTQDDSPNNIVLSCVACNRYKDTFDPRTVTGPNASREALIAAASKKIEELRNANQPLLDKVRSLVDWTQDPTTAS